MMKKIIFVLVCIFLISLTSAYANNIIFQNQSGSDMVTIDKNTGNVTAVGWFKGLFNWVEESIYSTFNGTTLTLNDALLNTNFNQTQIILDSNASWLSTYNATYNALNLTYGTNWYNHTAAVTGIFVPYTGATNNVNLGSNNLTVGSALHADTTTGQNQVGIGINNPEPGVKLHIKVDDILGLPTIFNADILLQDTSTAMDGAVISLIGGNGTGYSAVFFGDSQDENIGSLLYDHHNNSMRFTTNAITDQMVLNATGSLILGSDVVNIWLHNQTASAITYTDAMALANNASWLSTYNATYANFAYNQTESLDNRFVNIDGDNMTGNLNLGGNNISDVHILNLSDIGFGSTKIDGRGYIIASDGETGFFNYDETRWIGFDVSGNAHDNVVITCWNGSDGICEFIDNLLVPNITADYYCDGSGCYNLTIENDNWYNHTLQANQTIFNTYDARWSSTYNITYNNYAYNFSEVNNHKFLNDLDIRWIVEPSPTDVDGISSNIQLSGHAGAEDLETPNNGNAYIWSSGRFYLNYNETDNLGSVYIGENGIESPVSLFVSNNLFLYGNLSFSSGDALIQMPTPPENIGGYLLKIDLSDAGAEAGTDTNGGDMVIKLKPGDAGRTSRVGILSSYREPTHTLNVEGEGNFTGEVYVNSNQSISKWLYNQTGSTNLSTYLKNNSNVNLNRIGINTATPGVTYGEQLDIQVTDDVNAFIRIDSDGATDEASGIFFDTDYSLGSIGIEGTGAYLMTGSVLGDLVVNNLGNYNLVLATNNTRRMTIDSQGRIGVGGRREPEHLLDINASSIRLAVDTAGNANSIFYLSGSFAGTKYTSSMYSDFLGGLNFAGSTASSSATLNWWSGNPSTRRMRILYNGYIGMGTDNPSTKLEVMGTLNVSQDILVWNDINISNNLKVGNDLNISGTSYLSSIISSGELIMGNINISGVSNELSVGTINATTSLMAQDYYSGDGSQGITNTSGLWVCVDALCSDTVAIQIKDGLITSCS